MTPRPTPPRPAIPKLAPTLAPTFALALCVMLVLPGCEGVDWTAHGSTLPVGNASNSQPEPTTAFPPGASPYGNPPNLMEVPKIGQR